MSALRRFSRAVSAAVAAGLTWGLLGAFYFLYFVPGRIVLAFLGPDPLRREFPSKASSRWTRRGRPPSGGRYRRQFQ